MLFTFPILMEYMSREPKQSLTNKTKRIMKKLLVMVCLMAGMIQAVNAQGWYPMASTARSMYSTATLTIRNQSEYTLTVKIMRTGERGLYQTVYIGPKSSSCVSFSRSGSFYTKTKAEKDWSGTLYKRGGVFRIQNDETGYSEATLDFFVSSYGGSGQSISRAEFESDR